MERDRQTLPRSTSSAFHRMIAVIKRLSEDISALLEHAHLESGRAAIHADCVDLSALATEVLDELRPHAEEKLRIAAEPGAERSTYAADHPRQSRRERSEVHGRWAP